MKLFEDSLIDELIAKAAVSPRRRAHFNIHPSSEDLVQRFLVAVQGDSYFRPHRHRTNSELAVVLRGSLDLVVFDDAGHVRSRQGIGEGTGRFAYETDMGAWHTLIPVIGPAVFFEVKQGPYDPATASEFAPWAPAEGDGSVARFQRWLREAQEGGLYSV